MPEHIARTAKPAGPGTFSRDQPSKDAGNETMPEHIARTVRPAGPWNLFTGSTV